ncbi:hypothetical protein D3C84_633310 [compost metagenome]
MGGEDVGRGVDRAQVQLDPAAIQVTGFQVVLQIGVAQVPAVHRPRQVGAVVVPEQQVQRVRFLALEVLVDVVVPPQIVRAQQREGVAHVLALEQADGAVDSADGAFAVGHQLFVDEDVDGAGVEVIEEGGQQAHAGDGLVATCRQDRQRRAEQRAADAEPHAVGALLATDFAGHSQALDDAILDQVVPGGAGVGLVEVAPRHQEHRMALLQQMANHRVVRAQVEDVVLVDRWRNDKHRAPVLGFALRIVLEKLEQFVLEHHFARGIGQVDTHFESSGVALAHLAFLQVGGQVHQAGDQAAALGIDQPLQRVGIAGQEIARGSGGDRLLHQIQQTLTWFLVLDRQQVEQLQQKTGIEQVKRGEGTKQRLAPVTAGEPAVVEGKGLSGQ